MRKVRVLLAIRPRILSEVVRDIVARQPDMEVVRELVDASELWFALKAAKPEVVITAPADFGAGAEIGSYLLAASPRLKIIALSAAGDTAFLYKAGSPKQRIDDVGEQAILNAIRTLIR